MPVPSLTDDSLSQLGREVAGRTDEVDSLVYRCATFEGQMQALQNEIDAAQERLDRAGVDAEELGQTLAILQGLEAAWKKTFETALAEVVSRGLSLVFGEPMRMEIVSDISRGASAVEFQLTTGEGKEALTTGMIDSRGGSYVEVASFLFRVLLILASRPALRRVVIIDESFRMVEDANVPALAQVIRELVNRLGIQIILVTHMPAFGDAADVVYEVTRDDRRAVPTAQVRRIKTRNEARS